MLDELPSYEPEEEWTPNPDGCCESSARKRKEKGHGPFAFGTVGKVGGLPALVIADCGTCCGGMDDIKVIRQFDYGYGNGRNNEWSVCWIDAYEFTPDV
jgi:hypothetical protein